MVRAEVTTLKSLDHPHIMRLVDVLETSSRFYIITELMRGRELFDNIAERGRFTEFDAAGVVRRLAEALAHMHARGAVHRDLKPENVMFADAAEPTEPRGRVDPSIACRRKKLADSALPEGAASDG